MGLQRSEGPHVFEDGTHIGELFCNSARISSTVSITPSHHSPSTQRGKGASVTLDTHDAMSKFCSNSTCITTIRGVTPAHNSTVSFQCSECMARGADRADSLQMTGHRARVATFVRSAPRDHCSRLGQSRKGPGVAEDRDHL